MPLPTLNRLDYAVLPCSDLATMRHFYNDGLGLVVTYERADWIEFKLQNVTIALRPRREPFFVSSKSDMHSAAVQLAFRVSIAELDLWFQKLNALGIPILDPPRNQSWGHRTLYLADPEDNVVEIYADLPSAATD